MTNEEAASYFEETLKCADFVDASYIDCVKVEAIQTALKALQERKTGKWKKRLVATVPFTIFGYECPFCEYRAATNRFNFCPNCGKEVKDGEMV